MEIRPAAFVILAALLTAAAGAGGWLAVRQNRADAEANTATVAAVAAAADTAETRPAGDVEPTAARTPDPPLARDRESAPQPRQAAVRTVEADAGAGTAAADSEPAAEATEPPADKLPPAPEPSLQAQPDAPEDPQSDGPAPTVRTADAAPAARAFDLPPVAGWVRRTDTAARADADPPPVERLVIAAESVIGLQLETAVSSADARVEDDVVARVSRNVLAGGRTALSAGTRVLGSVVLVEQAGKLRGSPRLGVRFHTAVTDGGSEVPLVTDAVYREGPGRGSGSTRRIGGAAVGGAILGAIFGGKRGAAIGSAAGAAGGTAVAMAGDGPPATFQPGAAVTIRLLDPVTVAVDRGRPDRR